jgi:uncharacterized protein YdaU (DUF1376 family)
MPFYIDDWLTSVAVDGFTLEQRGAYLELLLRQWSAPTGTLPNDDRTLAQLSRLGRRWAKVGRPIIARCFVEQDGGLVNPRCRELWEAARRRSSTAKKSARLRWED